MTALSYRTDITLMFNASKKYGVDDPTLFLTIGDFLRYYKSRLDGHLRLPVPVKETKKTLGVNLKPELSFHILIKKEQVSYISRQ